LGGKVARKKKMTRPSAHATTISATTPSITTSSNLVIAVRA
jgi:hypothetical protein